MWLFWWRYSELILHSARRQGLEVKTGANRSVTRVRETDVVQNWKRLRLCEWCEESVPREKESPHVVPAEVMS